MGSKPSLGRRPPGRPAAIPEGRLLQKLVRPPERRRVTVHLTDHADPVGSSYGSWACKASGGDVETAARPPPRDANVVPTTS